jgi:hypothetical protein
MVGGQTDTHTHAQCLRVVWFELCLPKFYVDILNAGICECDFYLEIVSLQI